MKSEVKMGKQVEIERKYIIKMPDPKMISSESGYTESRILQIYLESEPGETHRIRRRERSGAFVYTETIKKRIDKISSFEDEREISEEEFIRLSKKMKSGTRPIIKTRYTFLTVLLLTQSAVVSVTLVKFVLITKVWHLCL